MAVKKSSKKIIKKTTAAKKTVAKKATVSRVKASSAKTKKTASAKKVVAVKRTAGAIKAPLTKTQLQSEIADAVGISKKEVANVIDELASIVDRHVRSRAAGEFTLPGLLKIKVVRKPATKARKGTNPFTGEPTTFKAKPARNVVKIKALKKLKDMVA